MRKNIIIFEKNVKYFIFSVDINKILQYSKNINNSPAPGRYGSKEKKMKILEYENLGLYVKVNNSGYYLTEYKDEATLFSPRDSALIKLIDEKLFNILVDDYLRFDKGYRKGHLIARDVKMI